MVLVIILTTIVVFFFILGIFKNDFDRIWKKILNGLGFAIGAFVFSFIILFITLIIIDGNINRPIVSSERVSIACLSDNVKQNGSFFLGCGQINGTFQYVYYKETKVGYTLETCRAKYASIVYTSGKPYVEYVYRSLPKDSFWKEYVSTKELRFVVIHVPKGSIKSNYELDAK